MDHEAMLNEALTLITALQQRVLFLAGRLGAVEKENAALKKIAEMKDAQRTGTE